MKPELIRAAVLEQVPGVVHGFTCRQGGSSAGPFASLNLSARVGDDRDPVRGNQRAVLEALGRPQARFVTLRQMHGDTVVQVTRQAGRNIEADGVLTSDPGAVIAVLVADCVPILLAHASGRMVAALHAGWRGTETGIAVRAVERLRGFGFPPEELRVAMGPAIGPCCFEIDVEVADTLRSSQVGPEEAVRQREDGTWVADLWQLNLGALLVAGIPEEQIEVVRTCTHCTTQFFSHRRDQGETGRQCGVIAAAST